MQHTKVSEVQCFFVCFFLLRSLVIERFHPLDWKGTHRTTDHPCFLFFFLVDTLLAQDRDTAGHKFPPSETRHMAGHCTKMRECHGAATRAGHREKSLNTVTGSVHFMSVPAVKWHLNESILHYYFQSFMLLQVFFFYLTCVAFFTKMPFKKIPQCTYPFI